MIRCTDLPTFSDADLIALARRGDAGEAWAELVARYRRFALKVARKTLARGGKAALADDDEVAWDAMSKAYEKLHRFDPSRPFSCWLGAIVRNTALDRLRQAHRRRHVSLDLVAAAPPADALVEAELRREAGELLERAINDLSDRDRQLLMRCHGEGAPVAELARAFGLAEQTIRGALSRAKKRVLTGLGGVKLTNADLKALLRDRDLPSC